MRTVRAADSLGFCARSWQPASTRSAQSALRTPWGFGQRPSLIARQGEGRAARTITLVSISRLVT